MQPESTSLRPHYAIARELGVSEQRMIAQYAIAGAADVLSLRALPPGPAPCVT